MVDARDGTKILDARRRRGSRSRVDRGGAVATDDSAVAACTRGLVSGHSLDEHPGSQVAARRLVTEERDIAQAFGAVLQAPRHSREVDIVRAELVKRRGTGGSPTREPRRPNPRSAQARSRYPFPRKITTRARDGPPMRSQILSQAPTWRTLIPHMAKRATPTSSGTRTRPSSGGDRASAKGYSLSQVDQHGTRPASRGLK